MAQLKDPAAAAARILVVGKTGQVGRHLPDALKDVGHTIAVGRETMDLA